MNLLTVTFYLIAQAAVVGALAAVENASGAVSAWMKIAPTPVWEAMIVIVIVGNVLWVAGASVWGEVTPLPSMELKQTVRAWLFPPPPAAKRAAYAKRQRRVIP
jgi:hypothetical protein